MPTIIVPYRDRASHLAKLLPVLKKKAKGWDIVIVEQADDEPFNRGKLLNIGVLEHDSDYYVFHDVDMIAQNNPYEVSENPVSLVKEASQFENGRPYDTYFGGVTGISKDHFCQINGFYNEFWGWGCEDDLLRDRLDDAGIKWELGGGKFKSLDHESNYSTINHEQYANRKALRDGLRQTRYDLVSEKVKDGVRYLKVATRPIMKTITITAYNRPHYFRQVCESLVKNDLRGWKIVVAFEPSATFAEHKKILDEVLNDNDKIWRASFLRNPEKKGVRKNPHDVLEYVFDELKSEINIYLEDDVIISPDVTKLAEWYYDLKSDKEILAVKLVNEGCKKLTDDKEIQLCKDQFAALGLIIKRASWYDHFKPNWFKDVIWEGVKRIGWDWSIHRGVLEANPKLYTLMPTNSRSNHIGREGGVHCTPDFHDATFSEIKVNQSIPEEYIIVDQTKRKK